VRGDVAIAITLLGDVGVSIVGEELKVSFTLILNILVLAMNVGCPDGLPRPPEIVVAD
jgi:hypothetical protein